MEIRIKITDFEASSQVEDYLDERILALEKHLGADRELARCEVEYGRDAGGARHGKNMYFAEISFLIPGRDRIYARNNGESINEAIDDVRKEIEHQIRKQKGSRLHYLRKMGSRVKDALRWG